MLCRFGVEELIKNIASVVVGKGARSSSEGHDNGPILSDSDKRLLRWRLQREARSLLPNERIVFCMRRMQSSTVKVMYSSEHQSAHYDGLMACGSVWLCPVCAARISEKRRLELDRAIASCSKNGGSVYLVTYTVAHKRYDNLEKLLQTFLSARRKSKQGSSAQKIRKQFNILGTVSAQEVTWSKLNGWHPHCHELVFFATDVDIAEYEKNASEQWQKAVDWAGLEINEHGFRVIPASSAAADYVAKYGHEPLEQTWGAAAEMTKAHLKAGRMKEHLTPFGMLSLIAQGCHELKPLFIEYAHCFKGKHQLVWSAGLRAQLQIDEPEKSDLQLATEQEEKAVVLGSLDREQWKRILLKDARGRVLEIARSGDWQQVESFLITLTASPPGEIILAP
jgi:hypothetical protein